MIELTMPDGQKVAINPAAIWHIRQAGGAQTAVYATSGAAVFVVEPYDQVVACLRQSQGGQSAALPD